MLGMVTATNVSSPVKIHALTDALAERSKAVAQGAIPQGRGLQPHRRHASAAKAHAAPLDQFGLPPPSSSQPLTHTSHRSEEGQHKWTRELWKPLSVTQLCSHYPQDSCVMGMVNATNFSIPFHNDAPTDASAERSKAAAQASIA